MKNKMVLFASLTIIACLVSFTMVKDASAQAKYNYIDLKRNNTNPSAVDDRSLAVGQSMFSGQSVYHAFLWKKSTRRMTDLGTLSQLGGALADLDRSQAWNLSSYSADRCGDDRDGGCDRDRHRDWNHDRNQGYGNDPHKSCNNDRHRDWNHDRNQGYGNDPHRSSNHDRDRSCSNDRDRQYANDRDRCGDWNFSSFGSDWYGGWNYCGDDRDNDRDRCGDDRDRCGDGNYYATGVSVVGQSWNLDWEEGGDNARAVAFLWDPDRGIRELASLGGGFSSANGINAKGRIVGYAETSSPGTFHACYWDGATPPRDLDNREGTFSTAYAINGRNQIVGVAETETPGIFHGFLWQASQGMMDLPPLPDGTQGAAFYLNREAVCGYSDNAAGDFRAVLWQMSNPQCVDLGDLGGNFNMALGMNDAGQVVGQATTEAGEPRAFIWTQAGGMKDLNPLVATLPPDITLTLAYSINNGGEILVQAEGRNGYVHSFLLIPISGKDGQDRDGGNDRDNCWWDRDK